MLEREVDSHFLRHTHQFGLQGGSVSGVSAKRELYASPHVAFRSLDAHSARQAEDGIDVEPLFGNDFGRCGYLPRRERAPDNRQDVSVLPLSVDPILVLFIADGRKTDVHAQFCGLEEQFLHHLPRVDFVEAHQDAERQCGVDVSLSDVEHLRAILGQDAHDRRRETRPVLSRDTD